MRVQRKNVTLVLKSLCSIVFFVILISFASGRELMDVLAKIHWDYFILSFLLTPVMVGVSCLKWKLLLDKGGRKVGFTRLFSIYLIGYFFSNLLPSTVGGDVVRSYYAGKEAKNQAYAAVSVFLERFSGILLLCLLVVVMPVLQPKLYSSPFIVLPALGGALALVICFILYKNRQAVSRLRGWIEYCAKGVVGLAGRIMPSRRQSVERMANVFEQGMTGKVEKVKNSMRTAIEALGNDRSFLVRIILLTVVFYAFTMVNVLVSYRAFGVELDFRAVCVLVPTALFVAHVPVTLLGNLGYFESVFVGYFLLIGVGPAESLAMGLLLRLKMLSLGCIGMLVYLSFRGSSGKFEEIAPILNKHHAETGLNRGE